MMARRAMKVYPPRMQGGRVWGNPEWVTLRANVSMGRLWLRPEGGPSFDDAIPMIWRGWMRHDS